MQIAFTGKGGSGKSTVGSLFIEHLRSESQRVLAIDADINVHLASMLGLEAPEELALSNADNIDTIRRRLLGTNSRVPSIDHFVPTTPPGPGSHAFSLVGADPIMSAFATPAADGLALMHVGTYQAEGIGTSCYHENLAILENLLSHAELDADDWIVCDMVAGTDAFSNSLHAQFDAIVIVVEPTPESVGVARKYRELAESAGTLDAIVLVGNKVNDADDLAYLEEQIGGELLASLPTLTSLRRARQRGGRPTLDDVGDTSTFKIIEGFARTSPLTRERRTALIREVHLRLAQQDWVRGVYGDITDQFPPETVASTADDVVDAR